MFFRVPARISALCVSLCISAPVWAMPELDIDEAKKTTATAALGAASLSAAPKAAAKPLTPTLHAHIDLTAQRMTVKSGGQTLHHWSISSGRTGHETPRGRFTPAWTAKMWHSRKYNMAPMPYSVFFNGGIATHGTTAVKRLGRPASHGCIRLTNANARKFYQLVHRHGKKRTSIVVTGFAKQKPYSVAQASASVAPATVAPARRYKAQAGNNCNTPDSSFSIMATDC